MSVLQIKDPTTGKMIDIPCLVGPRGPVGPQGEQGPAGADGRTPVKGVDYYTEADKAELVGEVQAAMDGVPAYWSAHLGEKVDEIWRAMEAAGRNKSAFFFYTDAHWWQYARSEVADASMSYTAKMEPALLRYLYRHTPVNKTLFGGDIIGEESDDRTVMAYLWEWRNALRGLPNHHSVVGNHDDGNTVNNRYSENYVYAYLLAPEEGPGIVHGGDFYYYMDDACEKTRYLFLDTAYKGLDTDQTAFVKDALISTPEGWHIVVVAHRWYDTDYTTNPASVGAISSDGSTLLTMFDSYNSRTGDYADCGGWVEFCVGGHTHWDYDGVSDTGIPIILVESSSLNDRSGLDHESGTTTETAISAMIADYSAHKISVIRIGRGESREVEITNYEISYTNVLPLATDTDGSVYNGSGYKADTRWSGSSNAEASYAGKYLTGYIPYSPGQTVYLKNVTMLADASSTSVHYFSAYGARIGGLGGGDVVSYFSGVTDTDNNITQFTIPDYGDYVNTQYIRIECTGLSEASVITINEEID